MYAIVDRSIVTDDDSSRLEAALHYRYDMLFEDKLLKCLACEREFQFSAGEQEFFATKQLVNVPRRCSDCRQLNKAAREGKPPSSLHEVECEDCKQSTRVPFKPTGKSPVYCTRCFHSRKNCISEEARAEKA